METVDFIGKIAKVDGGYVMSVDGSLVYCKTADEIGPAFVSKLVEKKIMQDYDDQFTQMELEFPDSKEK